MRLLLVTQDFPPDTGGIETYAFELAPRLAERCDDFLLVVPSRPGDEQVDAKLKYPVQRLAIRPDLLTLRAIPYLVRLSQTKRFDAAFHLQWPTVFSSLVARWVSGSPDRIAVTVNGKDTVFNPFQMAPFRHTYDYLRRSALTGADQVVTYSQFLARRAHSLGANTDKIDVIPFGTNPDVFYPEDVPSLRDRFEADQRPIILTAGRLVRKKGFDTAIRALSHVKETLPDVRLLIAGDGPERTTLEELVQNLDLTEYVHFLGEVSQDRLRKYYTLADVFLMAGHEEPDDIEGFGLVYIEANACGTPTIGARVGGVPDAVRHEETGLLVPPQDPPATANALIRLLTNPDLAERLGEQGRQRVMNEANWDDIADRVFSALQA